MIIERFADAAKSKGGEPVVLSPFLSTYAHSRGCSCVLRAANVIYDIIQRAGKTGKWSKQEKNPAGPPEIRAERRENSGFEQR